MKAKKFVVELKMRYTEDADDGRCYVRKVVHECNDIFEAQAAFDALLAMGDLSAIHEMLDIFSKRLRARAKLHHHPNFPCYVDERKKGLWTCGVEIKVPQ